MVSLLCFVNTLLFLKLMLQLVLALFSIHALLFFKHFSATMHIIRLIIKLLIAPLYLKMWKLFQL